MLSQLDLSFHVLIKAVKLDYMMGVIKLWFFQIMTKLTFCNINQTTPAKSVVEACRGRNSLKMNAINELPDDILICILSRLTMKEAAKTSLLSKRWRHVWQYIPVLNFDPSNIPHKAWKDEEWVGVEEPKYFKWVEYAVTSQTVPIEVEEPLYFHWVEKVVNSHKAPAIDEFRVVCDFPEERRDNLDSWVRFAVEKRVKRLGLDVSPTDKYDPFYTFPGLSFCNTLTSLELAWVDVTGEVLEKLLSDCQALELLSVTNSRTLVAMKVVGASLNLKSLEIIFCSNLKQLEISAPNLRSFEYFGPQISWRFQSSPNLAEISVGGRYGEHLLSDFSDILGFFSQIEVLSLKPARRIKCIAKVLPVFSRVKILHVAAHVQTDVELFGLSLLMKACPLLQQFILEITRRISEFEKISENVRNFEVFPHTDLKLVEIIGFHGHEIELGFAMYLIENIVSLEKLIIVRAYFSDDNEDGRRLAKQQAEQLRSYLRPEMVLEIR